jgi:hypothetical protein
MVPFIGQKWNHLLVKNGTIYLSKMEPFIGQKWNHLLIKNGTIYWSKMEPFIGQKWNACRCIPFSHAGFHLLVKNGIFHFPTVRKMEYSIFRGLINGIFHLLVKNGSGFS